MAALRLANEGTNLGGTAKFFRPCKLISFAGAFSYFLVTVYKASSTAETAPQRISGTPASLFFVSGTF